MASARQRNGKWYYRITVTVGDGSHKYIERGSWKTKREAINAGKELEEALKYGGLPSRQTNISFDFLSKEWIEWSVIVYKLSTIQGYKKELKTTIIPAISPQMCQKIINNAIEEGYSRNRITRIKNCLSQCFKYAMRMNYISTNPCFNLFLPNPRSIAAKTIKPTRLIRPLTKDEIRIIFERFPKGHPDFIPLLLGYRCGLRLGEAFGILLKDINLTKGYIHIQRQIQFDESCNELYFTEPKYCKEGEGRIIYLDNSTLSILKEQVDRILQCSVVMHYPTYYISKNGILNKESGRQIIPLNLRIEDGTYISPRTMQHTSRVIHGKISSIEYLIPDFEFHMLRHTHASELIASGMNPVSVQQRLGHKRLETTYRYYIHETETQVTQSREIIEKMFGEEE